MARWPRNILPHARTWLGSLGANGGLCLRRRAGTGQWGRDGIPAGRGGAHRCAGLARYEPSAAARPCRTSLLAAEAGARAAGLGLWGDPYYAVIAAADRASFAQE